MICGNTRDFIDHPLYLNILYPQMGPPTTPGPQASHYAWAQGPPPSKSGAGAFDYRVAFHICSTSRVNCHKTRIFPQLT